MAINDKPVFTPGRDLTQEELQRMLGLRPADWATPYEGGVGEASGGFVDPTRQSQGWSLDTGRFSPTLYYEPTYDGGGNGRRHDNGARYTTGGGLFRVVQPRNASTWGNSDSFDVWDDKGVWQGVETDGTTLRGLVNMGLLAAGANNLPPAALKGAGTGALVTAANGGDYSDIVSAAGTGAVTGTVAHGINTYGAEQGWDPAVTRAVSGGTTTALRGGDGSDVLKSGLLSSAGSLANVPTTSTTGGSMDFNIDPSLYTDGGDFGTVLADTYGDQGFNFDTSQYDFGFDPSMFSQDGTFNVGNFVKSLFTKSDGKGGTQMNALLPMLLGGMLGAKSGKDTQAQSSVQPWEPMQPYLKGLAADGANIYNQLRAEPFNAAQRAGLSNMGGLLDLYGQQAAGLLQGPAANASGANQFRRGAPQQGLLGTNFRMWGNPQSFGTFGM